MKIVKIFLVIGLILILPTISLANSSVTDYHVETLSKCSNPTLALAIKVPNSQTKYNTSILSAPKNTCVKIELVNADFNVHTFTITNVTYFNIFAPSGSTSANNFLTPNANVNLKYFSAVPGDTESGTFSVGSTNTSNSSKATPGFTLIFISLALVSIVFIKKRKIV